MTDTTLYAIKISATWCTLCKDIVVPWTAWKGSQPKTTHCEEFLATSMDDMEELEDKFDVTKLPTIVHYYKNSDGTIRIVQQYEGKQECLDALRPTKISNDCYDF